MQVIVVTSGKGGVGKTTATANIGAALSMIGKKVALIDTDMGLRNLDVIMGLENSIVYTIADVIEGTCRLRQGLVKDCRFDGLYLMPAAQKIDNVSINPKDMIKLCSELRENFDYILLDCPAGIDKGFENAVAGADYAIIVTTPEVSAVRDADRVIEQLEKRELGKYGLIINKVRFDMVKCGQMMSAQDIVDILCVDLLGVIPDESVVITSTNEGKPVVTQKKSVAGKAYREIATKIVGEYFLGDFLDDTTMNEKSIFSKIKKLFTEATTT